jgi:maleate isomerase
MQGKIRRLGVLVPSSDSVAEADFKTFLPAQVSFHTARLPHSETTQRGYATLDEICGGIEFAAPTLVQVAPELIVFACTSGSFYKGEGWDKELERRITAATGVPALVTARAVRQALLQIAATRIFMITPYPEEINQLEIEYFRSAGLEVVDYTCFHCEKSKEVSDILPQSVLDRALQHVETIRMCDALFISCTGLRGMEVAEEAERQFGMPTITSNSATIYAALRAMDIETSSIRAGRLFRLPVSRARG